MNQARKKTKEPKTVKNTQPKQANLITASLMSEIHAPNGKIEVVEKIIKQPDEETIQKLQQKIQELEQEKAEMESDLIKSMNETQILQQKIKTLEHDLKNHQLASQYLKEENVREVERSSGLELKIQQIQATNKNLQEKIDSISKQLEQQFEKNAMLNSQNAELSIELEENMKLVKETEGLKVRVHQLETQNEILSKESIFLQLPEGSPEWKKARAIYLHHAQRRQFRLMYENVVIFDSSTYTTPIDFTLEGVVIKNKKYPYNKIKMEI